MRTTSDLKRPIGGEIDRPHVERAARTGGHRIGAKANDQIGAGVVVSKPSTTGVVGGTLILGNLQPYDRTVVDMVLANAKVVIIGDVHQLEKRQDHDMCRDPRIPGSGPGKVVVSVLADGQHSVSVVVVQQCQAELLLVIDALQPPGRFPRRLDRGQQQGYQNADDGDHHQEFHQSKAGPLF